MLRWNYSISAACGSPSGHCLHHPVTTYDCRTHLCYLPGPTGTGVGKPRWQGGGLRLEKQRPGNQDTECQTFLARTSQVCGVPREKGQAAGEGCRRSAPALCILSRDTKWSFPEKAAQRVPQNQDIFHPPQTASLRGPPETRENRGDSEQQPPRRESRELGVLKPVCAKPFKTSEAASEPTAKFPPCS